MSIMTKNANLVIGEIIRLGPATVKDCLLNFDASKPIWANKASLAKVTRENLDAFAEFLGIPPLYGEKGVKDVELKTKPRIALRIAQELKALTVPVKCAECSDMYQHNRNDLVHLRCFLCHQPSHNCEPVVSVITSRESVPSLVGEVWICDPCCVPKDDEKGTPLSTRVSSRLNTPGRSRSNSVTLAEISSEVRTNDVVSEKVEPSMMEALTDLAKQKKEAEQFPNICQSTCLLLKEGTCPHGISGKKAADGKERCEFFHPKLCIPWGKNGEKGCAKGPECKKLHKTLCSKAIENKECFEKKCYLVHPKGTNRPKPKGKQDQVGVGRVRRKSERGPSQGGGRKEKNPPTGRGREKSSGTKPGNSTTLGPKGKPGGKPNGKANVTPAKSQVDFLAIKSLLEKLQKGMSDIKGDQIQMQKTLKTLKADQGQSCGKGRTRAVSSHGCCSQACC